jgi:hypothetical protein
MALQLMLQLALAGKEDFVASLGGPDGPVGDNGMTVAQLADRLEACLERLTAVGYRVHPPQLNRERFWEEMTGE